VTVGVTEGGLTVITTASAQKQVPGSSPGQPIWKIEKSNLSFSFLLTSFPKFRVNHQPNFGPNCRLGPSPEASLGATVGTLNQGYPLLQYEETVPVQLSLAAW
jgi:hypothetical protein